MEIYIEKEGLIRDISGKFHAAYPFLKIAFFKHPHLTGEGSPKKEKLPESTPIRKAKTKQEWGWIDISEDKTVAEVESGFFRRFGLSAQVFRKGNNCWLETTRTDHLTLKEQNEMGKNTRIANEDSPEGGDDVNEMD